MGLKPKWVYFDACIVIYLVEQSPGFVENIAAAITQEPDIRVCISPLVEMECMVGVLKQQDKILHSTYKAFFNTCHMLDIQASTFRSATDKRLNKAAGQLEINIFSGKAE